MREKIRLSDLTILYICLSNHWGTKERRCLSDAVYFRNIGGVSFILCLKESLIDLEADKEDIPRLYFDGDLKTFRGNINFYFQLQHILLKRQIDIIHSHNFEPLRPLGLVLNGMPQIPLVYTYNEMVHINKRSWIDRWLISRTDVVLTFSKIIRELASEFFPINSRKIHVTGAGIDFQKKKSEKVVKDRPVIATFITRNESNPELVKFFIESMTPVFQALEFREVKEIPIFLLLTDVPWHGHPLFEQLKRVVLERHLEMDVRFENRALNGQTFKNCDIFVGLPLPEIFVDQDLYALVTQVPVLLPRTACRQQLIHQGKFGETYHPEDSREFRSKLIKMLLSHGDYRRDLHGVGEDLQEDHHFENYVEQLYSHYERLYGQRMRYSNTKKKII